MADTPTPDTPNEPGVCFVNPSEHPAGPLPADQQPPTAIAFTNGEEPTLRDTLLLLRDSAHRQRALNILAEDKALASIIAVLRMQNFPLEAIARALGTSVQRCRRLLVQARRDHKIDALVGTLREDARLLAHEQLLEKLHDGDYRAIRDTLKGFGDFRQYSHQEGGAPTNNNQLTVIFENADEPVTVDPKGIIGAPKVDVHAEVIDATIHAEPIESAGTDDVPSGGRGGDLAGGGGGESPRDACAVPQSAGARLLAQVEQARTDLDAGLAVRGVTPSVADGE